MAPLIQPRQVPAAHGAQWVRSGALWLLQSPFGWLSCTTLWIFFAVVSLLFPLLGPVAFSLTLPGIFAGFMLGCAAIEREQSLKPRHLFEAFKRQPRKLMQLGLINLTGETLLSLILLLWSGPQILNNSAPNASLMEQMQASLPAFTTPTLILVLVQLALLMMSWFTPILLIYTPLTTLNALSASTYACLNNLPAFAVYALTMILLLAAVGLISSWLPWLVGPLGILMMSLIIASVYASCRDIFVDLGPATQPE